MILLHGYLADKTCFESQVNYFGRYFNVHAIDLKGFGKNRDMQFPYSLEDYSNDLVEYVKSHNLSRPFVLGHSFGGRVIIKTASRYPDMFSKIVLVDSAGVKPKRTLKKVVKKSVFRVLKVFIPKSKLKFLYSSDYNSLSQVMRQSFIKVVNEDLTPYLKNITAKTLIVFGDKDKDTPLYMAKILNKEIKGSSLVVLKGAGHFSFLDKPYKFNKEVGEFLFS